MKCESFCSEDHDWFFGLPPGMDILEAAEVAARVHKELWESWGNRKPYEANLGEFIAAMTAAGFEEINFEPHPADFWDERPEGLGQN